MRRPVYSAAFLLLLLAVPLYAQRGGGHGGFGGRGGIGARGGLGGRAMAAAHPVGGHSFRGMRSASFGSFAARGHNFGGHFHNHGFHHRHCWGWGCGFWNGSPWWWGYGYAGYYGPWWGDWDSSYSNYDEEQQREAQLAEQMNALNLEEQRLREREDQQRDREQKYAQAQQTQPAQPAHDVPVPATVLVFRDQHRQEVVNYAIANGTLWVLNEQTAKKIPLADLDLSATAKVNDERGVEFQVPR